MWILRLSAMFLALAMGATVLRPTSVELRATGPHFVEVAVESGCGNTHSMVELAPVFSNIMPWLASVGAAAAAADYDGDGDADLYLTNSGRGDSNKLLQNQGDGRFVDVTARAGVGCVNTLGANMHAIWGDIDNDSDLDLYVVKWAAPNSLYRNNHDGTFTDVSAIAGVDGWGYANAATFLDYDRDGCLDILVGNYFAEKVLDPETGGWVRNDLWNPVTTRVMQETFTDAANGGRNVLYRNRGDGTFADVTLQVGLAATSWTLSVGSGDLNNDGWPDLYLANDFGPDECYLNTGATEQPPRFRILVDPRGHPGIGADWWKGMNIDMGDVNNDGYLDLYVTNIFAAKYKTDEGNMLWINQADAIMPGGRGFRNVGKESATFDGGWGWGGKFADFNHDGLLDIFTVNGFVTGDAAQNYWFQIQEMVTQTKNQTADARDWPVMGARDLSGREPSRLFMQIRGDRAEGEAPQFMDVAATAGISDVWNGRGIALADFDLDGDVDIFVANQGAPSTYYVNQLNQPNSRRADFIHVKLEGDPEAPLKISDRKLASTRDAVGARLIVESSHGTFMREVQGGQGFASQSEHALHFGLPEGADVSRITIKWPSGHEDVLDAEQAQLIVNRHMTLDEGLVTSTLRGEVQ